MAYLVLARKWRPQVFDDLVGQPHIIKVLKNALSQGRVHHAYVFSGPRGVGKTTTARILAKSLNCVNGPTPSPCGRCEFCSGIAEGTSLDVIEIDGASNNSVDDIREIRERVRYAPSVTGKYKVYIIDEAHMLSESAFNALLKTIEEPPPHTIFVLATTAYRKIPATVLSRCQHLAFRRIPRDVILERLRYISKMEGINISNEALDLIARSADGSMRDSLTLLDQVSSFADQITLKDVADLLGISDSQMVFSIADALFEGDRSRILSLIHEASDKGADLRTLYKDLIVFFRDILVLKALEGSEFSEKIRLLFDISQDDLEEMKRLSAKVSQEELVLMLNDLLRGEMEIKNATFPRIALEVNLIRLTLFKEFSSVRDVIERLKNMKVDSEPLSIPQPKTSTTSQDLEKCMPSHEGGGIKEKEISEKDESLREGIVKEFLRIIEERDHLLASKLSHAIIEFRDNELVFKFNGGHALFAKSLSQEEGLIKEVIEGLAGRPVKIRIITSRETCIKKDFHSFKKEVLSRPEVREIIELFEGSVLDIKERRR